MALRKKNIAGLIPNGLGFPKNQSMESIDLLLEPIKSSLGSGEDVLVSESSVYRKIKDFRLSRMFSFDRCTIVTDADLKAAAKNRVESLENVTGTVSGTIADFAIKKGGRQ